MPKVTDLHRRVRQSQIVAGARRAFARHGYEGATVALLEEATGLSRGAIFSYFPSKLDLFLAIARADRERFAGLWLDQGFAAVLRELATADPAWIGVHLEASRMLRTDAAVRARWEEATGGGAADVVRRHAELQARGELRSDLPVETLVQFLGVVLDGIAAQRGAGLPLDVDGTVELVRSALAPR